MDPSEHKPPAPERPLPELPFKPSIAQRRLHKRPHGLQLNTNPQTPGIPGIPGQAPPQTPGPSTGGFSSFQKAIDANAGAFTLRTTLGCPTEVLNKPLPPIPAPQQPLPPTPLVLPVAGGGRPQSREPVKGLNYLSAGELAGLLNASGRDEGLVIDVRRSTEFLASRVQTAISMTVPTTLVKRKSFTVDRLLGMLQTTEHQRRQLGNWKAHGWIVLYGEGLAEETAAAEAPLVLLAKKFMSEAAVPGRVYVLEGGYRAFQRTQAGLCEKGPVRKKEETKLRVDVNHPMLRKMRQAPGGGFDSTDVVAVRMPPDFVNTTGQLPEYLQRAADPDSGAMYLMQLFGKVDRDENSRLSVMISCNGMETEDNRYTITAGLELGSKNRYNNIFPFDRNRVRLKAQPASKPPPDTGSAMRTPLAGGITPGFEYRRPVSYSVGKTATECQMADRRCSHQQQNSKGKEAFYCQAAGDEDRLDNTGYLPQLSAQLIPPGATLGTNDESTYINASYISYFGGPLYISTQGPLEATAEDFWRMVWEQQVRAVVMLTQLRENGRSKCHRYWPEQEGGQAEYGEIRVTLEASARHPDDSGIEARRLKVEKVGWEEPVAVTQLQYTGWADHGAPDNPLGVLRLQQLARRAQQQSQGPMVVHCSAGCGRTGAFCAIDTVIEGAKKRPLGLGEEVQPSLGEWGRVPPREFHEDLLYMVVSRFRELRVSMVQTNRQFVFCHEALVWHWLGAGPRALDQIVDERLVAEWNRVRYPQMTDEEDLTMLMRGQQDMRASQAEDVVMRAASMDEAAIRRSTTLSANGGNKRGMLSGLFRSGSVRTGNAPLVLQSQSQRNSQHLTAVAEEEEGRVNRTSLPAQSTEADYFSCQIGSPVPQSPKVK